MRGRTARSAGRHCAGRADVDHGGDGHSIRRVDRTFITGHRIFEPAANGLTHSKVLALRAVHGRKVIARCKRNLWRRTVREALTEPIFLLLLSASGLCGLIGDLVEAPTLFVLLFATFNLGVLMIWPALARIFGLRPFYAA
jgi:hypothetical protein